MANDLVTQDERLPASTDAPAEFRTRLDEMFRDRRLHRGRWTLTRLPSPVERRALDERGKALASRLRPMSMAVAEMDAAVSEIGSVLAGYLTLKADPKRASAGFVTMLKELPLFAVRHACGLLREGAVEGISPEYPPTAPLIYKLAREHCEPYWEEAAKIKAVLAIHDARELPPPPKPTGADAARIAERVNETRNHIRAASDKLRADDYAKTKAEAQAARDRIDAMKLAKWRELGREPVHDRDGHLLWPSSVEGAEG